MKISIFLILFLSLLLSGCGVKEEEEEEEKKTSSFEDNSYRFVSDWMDVKEINGISYRTRCVHGLFKSSVQFYVQLRNLTDDTYIHTRAYFGIPSYTDELYASDTTGIGPNNEEEKIYYKSYSSLDPPVKQCEEPYSGKIELSYADKNGSKVGDTLVTIEFDSTTLPLNF